MPDDPKPRKKLTPFAWGIIVGGALLVALIFYEKKKQKEAEAEAVDETDGEYDLTSPDDYMDEQGKYGVDSGGAGGTALTSAGPIGAPPVVLLPSNGPNNGGGVPVHTPESTATPPPPPTPEPPPPPTVIRQYDESVGYVGSSAPTQSTTQHDASFAIQHPVATGGHPQPASGSNHHHKKPTKRHH